MEACTILLLKIPCQTIIFNKHVKHYHYTIQHRKKFEIICTCKLCTENKTKFQNSAINN